MSRFNERLKDLRINKAITQKEIGKLLGVSDSAIRYYEVGKREPNIDGLLALARYFDVSIDYLVGFDDIPNRKNK